MYINTVIYINKCIGEPHPSPGGRVVEVGDRPSGLAGVPWSNYRGWVLSAAVAAGAFDVAFDRGALLSRLESCPFMLDDMASFAIRLGGVNAAAGNPVPVALTGALGAGLVVTDRFDVLTRPRWMN